MTIVENETPRTPPKLKLPLGVLCAKCEHLNPPGSTVCEHCQAALYRPCKKCGQAVQAALTLCPHCGARSTRGRGRRVRTHAGAGWDRWRWLSLGLTLLLLAALYWFFRQGGNSPDGP